MILSPTDPWMPFRPVALALDSWSFLGGDPEELLRAHKLAHRPPELRWSQYCALCSAVEVRAASAAVCMEIGRASLQGASVKQTYGLLRLMASPMALYRVVFRYLAPNLHPLVTSTFTERPDGSFVMTMAYPPSGENALLGWATTGICERLPSILGLPDARVEARVTGAGAEIQVWPPKSQTLWRQVRSLFSLGEADAAALHAAREQHQDLAAKVRDATLARQSAEAAERAQSEFLTSLSGEANVALAGLVGRAAALARDPALPAEEQETAQLVYQSAASLQRLLHDVLTLARAEQGQPLGLTPRPVDPLPLLAAAPRLSSTLPPQRRAFVDPDATARAFTHLLENALRFSPPESVCVRCYDDIGTICVEISDRGPGIPPAHLPALFHPFRQLDGSMTRRAGGAGVGLALSRSLLRAMNGDVQLSSTLGAGTTVTMRLPAAPQEPA